MTKVISFVFDDRSLASIEESDDAYHIRIQNEQAVFLPKKFFAIERTMDRNARKRISTLANRNLERDDESL